MSHHPGKKYSHLSQAGQFESEEHYYTKVLNASVHPLVSFFFALTPKQIIARYKHMNPTVDGEQLLSLLKNPPKTFRWAGADLFYCTSEHGNRRMVIVETNSCPSGQKSMPLLDEHDDFGGYRRLVERTLKPVVDKHSKDVFGQGHLAVVYDKNSMEALGYAKVMAEVFDEDVVTVELYDEDKEDPPVRWRDGVMHIRQKKGDADVWVPIRIAFRYVTQKPWNRFPAACTKTLVLNPVVACLAGGRNKLTAAKAYQFFNSSHSEEHLEIRTPQTIRDLAKSEVPFWAESFGGFCCVKVPYSNAGQGVFTITNEKELQDFMEADTGDYDQYIVQSLVASYSWSSKTQKGQLYHVGSVPDKAGRIYVVDIRMMIHFDYVKNVWRPLVMYSRRAPKPLPATLDPGVNSWDILGTNLSYKTGGGDWATDSGRLLIADRRDFNKLGVGIDDLIDGFIQTVLASVAIDELATKLIKGEGEETTFDLPLFESLNKDPVLAAEISCRPEDCYQLEKDATIIPYVAPQKSNI